MQNLTALIGKLKQAGITPRVQISVAPDAQDIQPVLDLLAELKGAGITPEVSISVTPTGQVAPPPAPDLPPGEEASFEVAVTDNKLNCMEFTQRDAAGKPIMEIHEPRIQLFKGARFSVSATHKESDKDAGDGTIIGTGGVKYYQITDCPPKREAERFFIRQSEVARV
jgi:hypothetical protein